jgi:hypothetical protein
MYPEIVLIGYHATVQQANNVHQALGNMAQEQHNAEHTSSSKKNNLPWPNTTRHNLAIKHQNADARTTAPSCRTPPFTGAPSNCRSAVRHCADQRTDIPDSSSLPMQALQCALKLS